MGGGGVTRGRGSCTRGRGMLCQFPCVCEIYTPKST